MLTMPDTIDLQNKSSPTAKDHSQQPEHPAPLGIGPAAPHQQASLRQVQEDRHDEEERLQDAWNTAGQELRDGPGSDDDDDNRTLVNSISSRRNTQQQDEQAVRLNGGASGDGDDSDMHDADAEEDLDDDDDMDKISSSPSIDDGGYSLPLPLPAWPQRMESLTPVSSPLRSPAASSSPFTATPIHFPISVANARRTYEFPAIDNITVSTSPYQSSPISISLRPPRKNKSQSEEHHRGEYAGTRTASTPEDESDPDFDVTMSPRSKQRQAIERRLKMTRQDSEASFVSDLDEDQASNMLQPMKPPISVCCDDPFSEPAASPPRTANGTPPPTVQHSDDDSGSWTTDSDADSWHGDLDNDDDASNDVSFSDDPRFVDSGWGGECLRETEDIDFEFVYALHTFVATVEGQANATKGDTMVLLDDSNSYWWLVRVVKDSSIGGYFMQSVIITTYITQDIYQQNTSRHPQND
jgi:hypothetical protein